MTGIEPRPQRWEARVLPLCHRGPFIYIKGCKQYHSQLYISSMYKSIFSFSIFQEIKYTVSGIRNNKLTNFNSTNLILKEKNEL